MNLRALLASPLGFLIGLSLGTLGGGGSILAVPALVYAAGQDPKAATASSLLLVGAASLVGILPHARSGRVLFGLGIVFGVAGIPGSLLGSSLNRGMDADLLLLGFSVLTMVAAWRMVTGCPSCTRVGEERALAAEAALGPDVADGAGVAVGTATVARREVVKRFLVIAAAGTAVGFLTGLFGVGGGFVIVPALTLLLAVPMQSAVGTSLLIITINTVVALSTRLATTTVEWEYTLPFTVAAIFGVLAGGRIADRIDADRTLRWFAALLVVVGVYTAIDAIIALT